MTVNELKIRRKAIGISQKRLSKLIKKHPTFVCKLESGNRLFTNDLQKMVAKTLTSLRVK